MKDIKRLIPWLHQVSDSCTVLETMLEEMQFEIIFWKMFTKFMTTKPNLITWVRIH